MTIYGFYQVSDATVLESLISQGVAADIAATSDDIYQDEQFSQAVDWVMDTAMAECDEMAGNENSGVRL